MSVNTEKLAARLVRNMEHRGALIDRNPGEVNLVYGEAVTLKVVNDELVAERNDNAPDKWNDVRCVLQFENGKPYLRAWWQATTEPGRKYVMNPVSGAVAEGAARIALGYQRCWQVGKHRASSPGGHEALVQTGAAIMVLRDKNKDFKRDGDKVTKGFYGINQHGPGNADASLSSIGGHSAGCLVVPRVADHKALMAIVKADPRYRANPKFVFGTTVLEAVDFLSDTATAAPSRPDARAPAEDVLVLLDFDADDLRAIFPKAPQRYLEGLLSKKDAFHHAGITATRTRFAYMLAQVEHECGGFTIPDLTENINYSAVRMAQVWPSRFPGGAADVVRKYGAAPGWQEKAIDDIYGNRMGNRPGTSDGSMFIGRSAIQITGRDGYGEVGKRIGVDLVNHPELASEPNYQAPIIAAFWSWKGLNAFADAGDFVGQTKRVNGGTNGLADRQVKLKGNDPIVQRLAFVKTTLPALKSLPGGPGGAPPPKAILDNATTKERATRAGGVAAAGAGGTGEAIKAGTQQPSAPVLSPMITYTAIAVGIVVCLVGIVLLKRKVEAVRANWV